MLNFRNKGFTIIEIMVVVIIIASLVAIASLNYLKSNKTSAKAVCINNLREIDKAIDQWALDHNIPDGTPPTSEQEDEIYGYISGRKPECPSKGEYTIEAVGSRPQVRCSRGESEGHKLPE